MFSVPDEPATELENLALHSQKSKDKENLLLSYAAEEVQRKERVVEVDEQGGWVAVVPFWATWPFETLRTRYPPSLSYIG
jgi:UDPglucose--hexose-1-phosphate uridylyltransferase